MLHIKEKSIRASRDANSPIVLNNIDLRISSGEVVAILGESGVGKSTLLRSIRQHHANQTAWCPQHSSLVGNLSVFHNIYAGLLDQQPLLKNVMNFFWPQEKDVERVASICMPLDIQDLLKQKVHALSGGQQQRVNIARALIQQRKIFLGDEPVSALDEFQAKQILELITNSHKAGVIAMHNIELALACSTRVIGLKEGRIVIDLPSSECSVDNLSFLYPSQQHHDLAR